MSKSIEERVVSMRFDNKQFEAAAATSMSTLDKLKAKLNFRGAAKGLEEITRAADTVSLSGLTKSAEAVEVKFSAMSIASITAIQRIVDKAISAGAEITKSLTITPVSTGFQEYELKMNSVQTIMASTGEGLETVMGYLNELNEYADKTIYSFADMTKNIGTFTNAGVKLEDAVKAIQGISNEAAVSGANANQASHAMYNFAQALSSGYVRLLDWRSIEVANMSTVEFKNQLLETAVAFGTLTKASDGTYRTLNGKSLTATKNFNDTLQEQWLTTDVLITTLGDYADETTDIGKKAFAAAQDVKTFTQLLDTLKEAAGSGWAETWEIVIGNFEEAREVWTSAGQVIGDILDSAADERNAMLRDWKALGGRDSMLRTFGNAWSALLAVITPVRDAIRDIFPPTTGQQLANLTAAVERFTKSLILSKEASYTLKVAIKAFLIPINLVVQVARVGVSAIGALTIYLWKLVDAFLALPSKTDSVSKALKKVFGDKRYERAAAAVIKITDKVKNGFDLLAGGITNVINSVRGNAMGRVYDAFNKLNDILSPIGNWVLDRIIDGLETIANFKFSNLIDFGKSGLQFVTNKLQLLLDVASPVTNAIKGFIDQFKMGIDTKGIKGVSDAFASVRDSIINFDLGLNFQKAIEFLKDGFKSVTEVTGDFMGTLEGVADKINPVKLMIFAFGVAMTGVALSAARAVSSMAGTFDAVTGTLNGFTGVLTSVQKRLVPSKFQQIAYAIAVLAGALVVLSMVDAAKVQQATISVLALMGAMTVMVAALAAVDRFLAKSDDFSDRMQKLGVGMTLMSAAIAGLSVAVSILSGLNIGGFIKGLIGVITLMTAITVASALMAKFAPTLSKNSLFLIAFAASIMMVTSSLEKIAKADLEGIQDNLANIRTMMLILMGVAAIASRIKFGAAVGIGVLAINLLLFVKVLQILGKVDVGSVAQGLAPLIPVMILVSTLSLVARKATTSAVKMGGTILAMSAAVLLLVEAIRQISTVDAKDAAKATIVIAALFGVFSLIEASVKVLNSGQKPAKIGMDILAMSAAILALSLAIKYIGGMDSSVVAKGTLAVVSLLAMFAVIGKVGQAAKGSIGYIVTLTLAVGVLTTAMTLFTLIPADELAISTAALISMLTSFGVAMKLMSSLNLDKPIKTAVMMGVLLGGLTLALKVLSDMGVEDATASAIALSGLILAISASTNLLKSVKWSDAIVSAAAMASMLWMTTTALGALSGFDGTDLLSKAASLSLIIAAVSAATLGLSFINSAGILPGIAAFVIVIGGIGLAIVEIGKLMANPEYQNFTTNGINFLTSLDALIPVLLKMAAVTGALGLVGAVSGLAISGAASLALVVGGVAAAVIALGNLSKTEGFDDVITNGSKVFAQLGAALGSFIGNVIGGLVGGIIAGGAVSTAEGLSQFAQRIQPFLNAVKNIDSDSVSGATNLAKIVLAMTAASVVDGIASFLGLKGDLASVGEDLEDFAEPMANFVSKLSEVGADKINTATAAVNAISGLMSSIPTDGGILGFITGNKDLDSFGDGLSKIGDGIVAYWKSIGSVSIDQSVIEASVSAASSINELVKALPSTGGVFQEWFGEKDLSNFSNQLSEFGSALVAYNSIIANGSISSKIITDSASAAKSIATLVNELPSTGGKLQQWFGGKDLSGFATNLSSLGTAVSGYYVALTNSKFNSSMVMESADAIRALVDILLSLPKTGGFGSGFSGQQSLTNLGTQIRSLGDALVDFNGKVSSIDIAGIQAAVEIVQSLVDGIQNQTKKIEIAADEVIYIFVDQFDFRSSEFKTCGKNIVQGLVDGIKSESSTLNGSVIALCQNGIDAAKETLDSHSPSQVFYEIGYFIVKGLANGIVENASEATSGMTKLVNGLIQIAKNKLGIHSPSTVARDEVGRYIVRGIAEGITSDMSAEEAAKQKATNIVNAFKEQLDSIDLSMTTVDLEQKLWSNLFGGDPVKDNQKELESTQKKLELQAERVAYANAEYKATIQTLGESADETREAYNKFLQEKITLSELSKTFYDLQSSMVVDQQSALKQYGEILKTDQEIFKLMGWTQDQIREYAANKVGLNPSTLTTNTQAQFASVQDVFDFYMKDVEVVIEKTVSSGVNKATSIATSGGQQAGTSFTSGVVDGISSGSSKVVDAANGVVDSLKNALSSDNFEGSATSMVDGLLDGINGKITEAGNAGSNLFNSIQGAFNSEAEIRSPSRKMYESGYYLVAGLTQGINENAHLASDALANIFLMSDSETGETGVPLFIQKIVEGLYSQNAYLIGKVSEFLDSIFMNLLIEKQDPYYQNGYNLAETIVLGIEDGFTTTFDRVFAEVKAMLSEMELEVQSRISRMKSALGSISPVSVASAQSSNGKSGHDTPSMRAASTIAVGYDFSPKTSTALVGRISSSEDSKRGINVVNNVTNNYNWTQNNTSPKALSTSEIYRQSKNLFSQTKGLVTSK